MLLRSGRVVGPAAVPKPPLPVQPPDAAPSLHPQPVAAPRACISFTATALHLRSVVAAPRSTQAIRSHLLPAPYTKLRASAAASHRTTTAANNTTTVPLQPGYILQFPDLARPKPPATTCSPSFTNADLDLDPEPDPDPGSLPYPGYNPRSFFTPP